MVMPSPSGLNILPSLFNLIINSIYLYLYISYIFISSQWNLGLIKNIRRGGNNGDPNNYRGITLNSNLGKLFCTVLHERLSTITITITILSQKNKQRFGKGIELQTTYLLNTIVNKTKSCILAL